MHSENDIGMIISWENKDSYRMYWRIEALLENISSSPIEEPKAKWFIKVYRHYVDDFDKCIPIWSSLLTLEDDPECSQILHLMMNDFMGIVINWVKE